MRVLVGYDGSASADRALRLVSDAAWPAATECHVIVVCGTPSTAYPPGTVADGETLQSMFDAQSADAEHLARSGAGRLARPELIATWEVGFGRPGSAILDAAEVFGADLIVVGSRGLGPIGATLLGSISEEVVDHARCPVLVVRGSRVRTVVFATDGSADALSAGTVLLRWPMFRDADVRVVSVTETPGPPPHVTERVRNAALPVLRDAGTAVEELAETTTGWLRRAGLHAEAWVRQGDPAAEILRAVDEASADLVVLGTRGRSGLRRLLHGSVARKVLEHARCSVLIGRSA